MIPPPAGEQRGGGEPDDDRRADDESAADRRGHGEGPDDRLRSRHLRTPRQERSRRTLERIVSATRSLIAEEGLEGATISRIVERSGTSIGSFYARFDGKDALIRYLEERVWAVARGRWEEARAERDWSALDLEGVIRTFVRLLVRIHTEDEGVRRALEREGRPGGPRGPEARRFHARVRKDLSDLLLGPVGGVAHPRPERAVRFAYAWAVGGVRELLDEPGARLSADRGETAAAPPLDPETVTDELTRGLVAYLSGGGEGGESGKPERVEFFDVWE